MANLNLGQDVAIKIERKQTTAHNVAKSYPPIASCKNASLRFSYYHQPLWWNYGISLIVIPTAFRDKNKFRHVWSKKRGHYFKLDFATWIPLKSVKLLTHFENLLVST